MLNTSNNLLQCAAHDIPIPTVDLIERKQKDMEEARHYMYKDEDIEKVCVCSTNPADLWSN